MALLELQSGPIPVALMKANEPVTNLFVDWHLHSYRKYCCMQLELAIADIGIQ